MANDERIVRTRFEADTDAAQSAAGALGQAMEGLGGILGRITGMMSPLNLAIGGLAGMLSGHAIMHAGSEFENLQIGLAQTLHFMGAGGNTFADSLERAEGVLQQITADAGPLPGNAMDYANALQLAGAVVGRATGDYEKTYDLVKKTTAVAISLGGSAELGAIELNRMLDANHGMMHQMGDFNQKMLNAMRQLPGMANLTVHEFNAFTLDKRLDTVNRAMGQFDDMIKASSNTWTAVKGAIEATSSLLVKSATAPLFENAKSALQAINNSLIDSTGHWTFLGSTIVHTGDLISQFIVDRIRDSAEMVEKLSAGFQNLVSSGAFQPLVESLNDTIGSLLGAADKMNGMSLVGGVASGVAMAAGVGGPGMGMLIGGIAEFATRTQDVIEVLGSLGNTLSILVGPIDEVSAALGGMSVLIADVLSGALNGLIEGLNLVLEPLMGLVGGIFSVVGVIVGALQPALSYLWSEVGKLFTSIGEFLNPIIRIVGSSLLYLVDLIEKYLAPVFDVAIKAVSGLIDMLARLFHYLGGLLGGAAAKVEEATGHRLAPTHEAPQRNFLGDFLDKFKVVDQYLTRQAMTGNLKAPGSRDGGGRAVQDFRFSRFEITQKFAEGFDPDRIAVAFASDVGRLGEQKLQSGFEPMFAVR